MPIQVIFESAMLRSHRPILFINIERLYNNTHTRTHTHTHTHTSSHAYAHVHTCTHTHIHTCTHTHIHRDTPKNRMCYIECVMVSHKLAMLHSHQPMLYNNIECILFTYRTRSNKLYRICDSRI